MPLSPEWLGRDAATLASRPSMVAKRPEIDGLRARVLVGLGRCPEAIQLVSEHPDRALKRDIHRLCRDDGR